MDLMGYDALNLGSPELRFGKKFLEHTHSHVSFPYIASNLLYEGSRLPWTSEYIIKETGGIKVAILGILNPDDLAQIPDQEQMKGFEVIPPEAALKRLLAEVKEKADLVILMSRFGVEKTLALVKSVKGVDAAISSGNDNIYFVKDPGNTVLLQTGSMGKTLGLLKISLDEKRALGVIENRHLPLGNLVPGNEEIATLVETHKKARDKEAADLVKEQADKRHKELTDGLKLSPQEFMERYRKEQPEKIKGEAR